MSKAILVMDMPSKCIGCPLHFVDEPNYWCGANMKDLLTNDIETYKPDWCPLKPMPQKIGMKEALEMPRNGCVADVIDSYNACIDELLSEKE